MLISKKQTEILAGNISCADEIFCSGLFLSARWFIVSQIDRDGVQVIVHPDKDSAEYCASDLYNLIEGDKVFFMPSSGKSLEKSNYKSSLGVQRTSAISKIMENKGEQLFIVTYPSALEEGIPSEDKIRKSVLKLSAGDEISHDEIVNILFNNGFERVDFVSEPGQFAVRGAIIDIFSYSYSNPVRISFFGDEVESLNMFDCNTQLSVQKVQYAEIFPDIIVSDVDMPMMDGIQLLKEVRSVPTLKMIPFIFLSAKDEDKVRFMGLSNGALDYLTKPFKEEELIMKLFNLLAFKRKQQQQYLLNSLKDEVVVEEMDPLLKKLMLFISENYSNSELSLDEIASEMLMSKSTLSRRLKSIMDKTPIEILVEYRLYKARDLLKNSKDTISEIAPSVGFDDPLYFSKKYKAFFGYSPSENR